MLPSGIKTERKSFQKRGVRTPSDSEETPPLLTAATSLPIVVGLKEAEPSDNVPTVRLQEGRLGGEGTAPSHGSPASCWTWDFNDDLK